MRLKTACMIEFSRAHITLEWLFTSVDSHVRLVTFRIDKRSVTNVTWKWPLSCVSPGK